jgi:hypothetical protein
MHFLWIYTDAILNSCKSMLIGVLKSLENGTVPILARLLYLPLSQLDNGNITINSVENTIQSGMFYPIFGGMVK